MASGLLLVFAVICASAAVGAAQAKPARTTARQQPRHAQADAVAFYTAAAERWRLETWYWQRLMGVPRSPLATRSLQSSSVQRLQHVASVWRRRAETARRHAEHPPNLKAWLCIHHYEGSWRDAGAPYYGGLQMDLAFQRAYGGWLLRKKGTADHWTPLEQIWTAVRARRLRGYYPWPNTARYCGLL